MSLLHNQAGILFVQSSGWFKRGLGLETSEEQNK